MCVLNLYEFLLKTYAYATIPDQIYLINFTILECQIAIYQRAVSVSPARPYIPDLKLIELPYLKP